MQRNFFRLNDVCTVTGYLHAEGRTKVKARVICVNRKSRYNQTVVALVDLGDSETIEAFCKDGTRYLEGREMKLTLGWKE